MKLLYCIPSLSNAGGMERILTAKVNYLANLDNFEVVIVTSDQLDLPIKFPLHPAVCVINLNINFKAHYNYNLLFKWIFHKRKVDIYKRKLVSILNGRNIDVCISMGGKEIEFLSKVRVDCVKIAELHFGINYRKQFLQEKRFKLLWRFLGELRTAQLINSVKGLDKLVVLTDRDLSQWHEKGVNAIKISNFNTLNCDKKSDVTNNSVLAVGRLDYQKGFDTLIDIWARVNHKFPNWVLNIYGDGEWHEKLKCQIEKYRLSNSIILRGTSDDMVNVYNEHSIYVMTSRFEGLPMVLIEAMSFGLPVVSLNCEFGPSEIVKNGVNGFLIEPQNVDEFESMLCRLMDSVDLRRLYGENAVQTAYFFSKDRVMGQWLDLLANLKFK